MNGRRGLALLAAGACLLGCRVTPAPESPADVVAAAPAPVNVAHAAAPVPPARGAATSMYGCSLRVERRNDGPKGEGEAWARGEPEARTAAAAAACRDAKGGAPCSEGREGWTLATICVSSTREEVEGVRCQVTAAGEGRMEAATAEVETGAGLDAACDRALEEACTRVAGGQPCLAQANGWRVAERARSKRLVAPTSAAAPNP